jgi:hypothetical protein
MTRQFLWGAVAGMAMSVAVVAVPTKAKLPGMVLMLLMTALQAWLSPKDTTAADTARSN